jgi:hypothetical protein
MSLVIEDIVAFLGARYDEDEQAARLMAEHYPPPWEVLDRGWMARVMAEGPRYWEVTRLKQWPDMPAGRSAPDLGDIIAHVARHDPARVLCEVEAGRGVLQLVAKAEEEAQSPDYLVSRPARVMLLALEPVLQHLALAHAGHPDYRKEWRP